MKTLAYGIVLHTLPGLALTALTAAAGELVWLPLLLAVWAVAAMWEAGIGQVRLSRAEAARTRAALRDAGLYAEPVSPLPSSRAAWRPALIRHCRMTQARVLLLVRSVRVALMAPTTPAQRPRISDDPTSQQRQRRGLVSATGEYPIIGRPDESLRLSPTWRTTAEQIAATPVTRYFTDQRMGTFADRGDLVGAR